MRWTTRRNLHIDRTACPWLIRKYIDPEAEILAQGRGLSWDEVVARAEQGRQRARTALSAFDDIPERATTWFVEDTTEHFEEHQAQIRAFNS